jgi:hypothetical protein
MQRTDFNSKFHFRIFNLEFRCGISARDSGFSSLLSFCCIGFGLQHIVLFTRGVFDFWFIDGQITFAGTVHTSLQNSFLATPNARTNNEALHWNRRSNSGRVSIGTNRTSCQGPKTETRKWYRRLLHTVWNTEVRTKRKRSGY